MRAARRGDGHLRRRARADRDRRRLEDADVGHRTRAGQRHDRRATRTRDLHEINEEHGYVDVSQVAEPPRIGDHLQRDAEPRLRLRQPARRAARGARRRRRPRDRRRRARPRALSALGRRQVRREHVARHRARRRELGVADLADAGVRDHAEQQRRLRTRQVGVLDDPAEQLAERLPRAPLERRARDERRQGVRRLDAAATSSPRARDRGTARRRDERADLRRVDDLARAHERLAVAEVEPRAVVLDRQDDRRARHGSRGSRGCRRSGPAASRAARRTAGADAMQPISGRVSSVVRSSKRSEPPSAG